MLRQKKAFRHVRNWMIVAAATTGALTQAAPPTDVGSAGRGISATDRALESRASVLGNVRGRSADVSRSAEASGGRSITPSAGQNSASTEVTAGIASEAADGRISATGATNSGVTSTGVNDRSRRPEATFTLNGNARRNQLADPATRPNSASIAAGANGRIGLDRAATRTDRVAASERSTRTAESGQTRPTRSFNLFSSGKSRTARLESSSSASRSDKSTGTTSENTESTAVIATGLRRDGQQRAAQADAFLTRRLAQIDRMRGEALANGDTEKLRAADRLEVLARSQYSQKTTGIRSVGSAMKEFDREPLPADTSSEIEVDGDASTAIDSDLK